MVPVIYFIEHAEPRPISSPQVDVDAIRLLRRCDRENLWYKVFSEMLAHAIRECDLEAIVYLYPLRTNPNISSQKVGEALAPNFCHLIDPFLVHFPYNPSNPSHQNQGNVHGSGHNRFCTPVDIMPMFMPRADDTEVIRNLKIQIREMMHM